MMKKIIKLFAPLSVIMLSIALPAAAASPDNFEKYELVSTPERLVVGVDAKGLVVYGKNGGTITAYDITTDSPIFALNENQGTVASFYTDNTAVIMGKTGYTGGVVSKDGTILAQLPEGYVYSKEYDCGFICLIDKNATENVYTIIDRRGKILAEHFFAPECELENGCIIISNAGGGHSIIRPDGSVSPFACHQSVRIEDAVSLCSGVYIGADGNVYSPEDEVLYKNTDFARLSPVNESYALGVKNLAEGSEQYIIDIKNKKETVITDEGLFGDYIYSEGHVCDGKAFVGNSEKSVLVNLKNGKVISSEVADYSCFYKDAAVVKLPGETPVFRFIKCDGTFFPGEYAFATDFTKGYAIAVGKTEDKAMVYLVNPGGKRYELHPLPLWETVELYGDYLGMFRVKENGNTMDIAVQKTSNGNVYIGNREGASYVFALKETGTSAFKVIIAIIAIAAVAFVAISAGYTAVRKRAKKDEKTE